MKETLAVALQRALLLQPIVSSENNGRCIMFPGVASVCLEAVKSETKKLTLRTGQILK